MLPYPGPQPDFEPEDDSYELGPAKQYAWGIVSGIGLGYFPWAGMVHETGVRTGVVDPGTQYEQIGRGLGEMGVGVVELLGGTGGFILGGMLDATGIGAIGGVAVQVASVALITGAFANIAAGASALAGTTSQRSSGGNAPRVVPAKRGPKTDPTAPHNAKVRAEAAKLEAEGNTIVAGGGRRPEKLVPTNGGIKTGRRPDIIYETPDGKLRGRNIGKTNADGTPVKREAEALRDLNNFSDVPTDFVPYDR